MSARNAGRLIAVVALALVSRSAAAQIPQTFENLQVFPKNIPRDTLVQIMRGFTFALGVRCEFCHVPREGAAPGGGGGGGGGLNFEFAKDDKDNKRIARHMLKMVDSINNRFLASIPNRDNPPTAVTCYTCHRGVMKPMTTQAVLLETARGPGIDSAIARYRTMRNEMEFGRFNVQPPPVIDAAQRLAADGKHADAVKLLEMLQEFYPDLPMIDFEIGNVQIAAGNRDAGIARYRAVLTKNPNHRGAQQALQRLGVQP